MGHTKQGKMNVCIFHFLGIGRKAGKLPYQEDPPFCPRCFCCAQHCCRVVASTLTRAWLEKTQPLEALVHGIVFIYMSLAFAEHVLDLGGSMLLWNLFSLAVKHQICIVLLSRQKASMPYKLVSTKHGNSTLFIHNYPAGTNPQSLSCVHYMGHYQKREFSFQLGRDF